MLPDIEPTNVVTLDQNDAPASPAARKMYAELEWKALSAARDRGEIDFRDAFQDINLMHRKFGVHDIVENLPDDLLLKFLKFRYNFLQEEIDEGFKAMDEGNADDVVDSLIDLIVVALGTLDLYGVNFYEAWYGVLKANMAKVAGFNPQRPNEFGAPDLNKPENWTAPDHIGNHGLIDRAVGDGEFKKAA